jgi:hypothetical protein
LQEARRHPDTAPPAGTPAAEFVPPAFMQPPAHERSQVWLWLAVVLLLGGVGAGVYFTSGTWLKLFSAKPVYLHLQALDMDGQLRIQWDRAALFSQGVQGGTLEIVDGAAMHSIPLDSAKILMGSFQYARQTQMVEVHLALRTGHGTIEEFTSFIGLPPRPPKAQDSEENRQSPDQAAEAERARGDLKKQELRTLELERSLEQMRQQMRREEERKRVENQMPAAPPPTATAQNPAVNRTPPPPASAIPPAPVNSAPASTAGKQTATVNSQPAEIPQAQPQSVPQEKAQPPAPKPAQTAAAVPPAQPALPSLSGRWVYSRASKSGSPFPPESINLMMTEAYGQVRGIFSGRYRVPRNRKFAPKVTLNFEGAIHPGTSKFTFTSPDGMKGDLEIIRLPGKQDAIEVVWTSPQDKLTFDDIFFRVP